MKKSLITSRDSRGLHAVSLFEAAFNKVGLNEEAAQRLNERGGELQDGIAKLLEELSAPEPVCLWEEKDGIISFSVISDGTTGPQWIARLKKKGFRLSRWAEDVLNSSQFKATSGVTISVKVLKGELFSENNRITHKIRTEAEKRKLIAPNAEVACLIREMFSDEELEAMGLYWIVVFHEPIKDSGGDPDLLDANRFDDGRWLGTRYGDPDGYWGCRSGFAFASGK